MRQPHERNQTVSAVFKFWVLYTLFSEYLKCFHFLLTQPDYKQPNKTYCLLGQLRRG